MKLFRIIITLCLLPLVGEACSEPSSNQPRKKNRDKSSGDVASKEKVKEDVNQVEDEESEEEQAETGKKENLWDGVEIQSSAKFKVVPVE